TLVVEGPPGIGKSSLLKAAAERTTGLRVLRARGSELERGFPLGIARQLVDEPLRRASAPERRRWLRGPAAVAEALIAPGKEEHDEATILHGLSWLIGAIAEGGPPLLLLVDDAHWADLGSLRLLCYVARRLEGLPVGMLIGSRPA